MSFIAVAQQLGSGMLASLSIFVLTLVFSLPLGLLVAFGRKSRIKPVQWLVKLYISIMRGTPLMLQLLVVYFGIAFRQQSLVSPLIMRHISQRFIVQESKESR